MRLQAQIIVSLFNFFGAQISCIEQLSSYKMYCCHTRCNFIDLCCNGRSSICKQRSWFHPRTFFQQTIISDCLDGYTVFCSKHALQTIRIYIWTSTDPLISRQDSFVFATKLRRAVYQVNMLQHTIDQYNGKLDVKISFHQPAWSGCNLQYYICSLHLALTLMLSWFKT
jgi:hypothetical protein